ncbi:MAG: trypsin-like peptidase domain-containing protein [Alphaproteobacteria bacterium]
MAALRNELTRELGTASERLAALEKRSDAAVRAISEALPHVVFLQSGYGYRHRTSGRMLRYVVDDSGAPLISPTGQPILSLESEGPVAEIDVIGTAFVLGAEGVLVTNRHVAIPWDSGEAPTPPDEELEPVVTKRMAYFPGRQAPVPVEIAHVSADTDLALLRPTERKPLGPGISLSDRVPGPGDEVFVMGYPTGLRAILAQAGAAFLKDLEASGRTDFWEVAKALSAGRHIVPLASRGIVARSTKTAIIYDAETTHGGSGGPVLDVDGKLIAVNTAVLPEFGGSNIGIPVSQVRKVLQQAGY